MAQKKNSKPVLAFAGLTVFSLWLLSVAPNGWTLLLIALMYVALIGYFLSESQSKKQEKRVTARYVPPAANASSEKDRTRARSSAQATTTKSDGVRAHSSGNTPASNRSTPKSSEMTEDQFVTFVTGDRDGSAPRFTIDSPNGEPRKAAAASSAAECWLPDGKSAKVGRYVIPGGLIYVGAGLKAASAVGVEPSLVNPALPIGSRDDYTVHQLDYFPMYAKASNDARAAYLNWLANGRRDPNADIGYVFLYFYGLERRAFIDARTDPVAESEIPRLCEEVRGLLSVYSRHQSFSPRARRFIDFFETAALGDRLYGQVPSGFERDTETSFIQRLALSQAVRDNQPVPAPWLLSWYLSDRQFQKPAAVFRCRAQFEALFAAELPVMFPKGIADRFKPEKAARLLLEYTPVYPGLESKRIPVAKPEFDIPDFTSSTGRIPPLLDAFGRHVGEQLDAYTRFIGRNPDKADSVEASLLLPVALWPEATREYFTQKATGLRGGNPVLEAVPLSSMLSPMELPEKFERPLYLSIIDRLTASFGVGVEPDPRFGNPVPARDASAVLFHIRGKPAPEPTAAYRKRAAEVWFYSAIARADGVGSAAEVLQADAFIGRMKEQAEPEQTRLRALLRFYLAQPMSMAGIKKRGEVLEEADRARVASELVLMCKADGGLTNVANLRVLEKLFEALGQDTQGLYSMAHAGAVHAQPAESAGNKQGARKSGAQTASGGATSGFSLDMQKIAKLREETAQVGEFLGAIFQEPQAESIPATVASTAALAAVPVEPAITVPDVAPVTSAAASAHGPSTADGVAGLGDTPIATAPPLAADAADAGVMGLDAKHSSLVRMLLAQSQWSRSDVAQLCRERGLMPDGAIERINDAAFDKFDDSLLDGDDPIEINEDLKREILS
ncbi:hypothetical protein F6X40_24230 [Paraburkholderia sp. UCT31]|uniref:TerB N-terminal domain-containing protein n=1 Tax=Paraburkholderia sp. UCT31 TaxID=2615209 RepID=UPI0016551480|nr:TerB N-terminal domain-containing protein [Paraburkholderia sp. UCT31]MBC8739825.1 hypothetical protein [Paraburkholderia sp. UCT31]